jgi:hypothetical protein
VLGCLCALALALWLARPERAPSAAVAVHPTAGSAADPSAERPLARPPQPSERVRATAEVGRATVGVPGDATGDAPEQEPDASPPLRRVRGTLSDAVDGAPLAGHRLELRDTRGVVLATVTTDALGRFLTEPIPCGDVLLRFLADLDVPERALDLWIDPGRSHVPPDPGGAAFELALTARRPPRVLHFGRWQLNLN